MALVLIGRCRHHRSWGNRRRHRNRTALAATLVASKVEDAVFLERAADGGAKLLLLVRSSNAGQWRRSIPLAGPDHHEQSAVYFVGAAFRDGARNTGRVTAKFSRELI